MCRYVSLILSIVCVLSSLMAESSVIIGDSTMFIGQETDSLTEAERYFNPIYLVVQKGNEHLRSQLIRGSVCDCDTTQANRRIGVFSVAPNKYVSFSQGNLQYFPADDMWKFADNQYDYCGNANKYISPSFRNWVDLFTCNTNEQDDLVDWGTHAICGDAPNTWRTLTEDEWEYLLVGRPNADLLRGAARVNGVNGCIFLPDNWYAPEEIVFQPSFKSYTQQIITSEQWSIYERYGAVFLPAAGRITDKIFSDATSIGNYWSITKRDKQYVEYLAFTSGTIYVDALVDMTTSRSVRLVHDTIVPEYVEPISSTLLVRINEAISVNMIGVEGGTFIMGASKEDPETLEDELPQHQVTLSDFYIGKYEVTQRFWCTIMGSNPSSNQASDDHPVENVSWDDCQLFIDKLNAISGLHFRLPTEAEWEYAARGGNKSKGYTYAGSNDINEVAWYQENCSQSQPVGGKKPNELGIYDMTGNVYEKCSDWYAPYPSEPQVNPQGADASSINCRIVRGGCWYDQGKYTWQHCCRAVDRGYQGVSDRSSYKGLRLVLDPKPTPQSSLPEYVDLGLSVKWATCNLGAAQPGEYGDYFAWGETQPKEEYTWLNYKWSKDASSKITKYNATDGLTTLEPADDAAYVNKGRNWRMPSKEEFDELVDQCTWEWTTCNGNNGYKVTGHNGNFIFLPAVGYKGEGGPSYPAGKYGLYWLRSNHLSGSISASCFLFGNSNFQTKDTGTRKYGFAIRPVYEEDVNIVCQYSLTHGNDYNAQFTDSTDRASIQPYTIFIPKGVTIAPKSGYKWGYYTNVDTSNMPNGDLLSSWSTAPYTGEGKEIGIAIKKDDGVFDFFVDSQCAKDYFDVSDPSIWE